MQYLARVERFTGMTYLPRHSAKRSADAVPDVDTYGSAQPADTWSASVPLISLSKHGSHSDLYQPAKTWGRDGVRLKPEIHFRYDFWPVGQEALAGDLLMLDIELRNPNAYAISAEIVLGENFTSIFENRQRVESLQPNDRFKMSVKAVLSQTILDNRLFSATAEVWVHPALGYPQPHKISCPISLNF